MDKLNPAQRRDAVQQIAKAGNRAIPSLAEALNDDNLVVRRTAARLLAGMGAPAADILRKALGNEDPVVRKAALMSLLSQPKADVLPLLETALRDDHHSIRRIALARLVAMQPRTDRITGLLESARADKDDWIRKTVSKALWPFYRESRSIRDRADWDHDIRVVQTIRLPKESWRFRLDPERNGHIAKWFDPGLDDSKWATINIEQAWQKAGYRYVGVAWYRRSIALPREPKHLAVEICFDGVDECAWVWVNGRYAGQHDIGPAGWDMPFTLDITREVKWGRGNQITVRAMNTKAAGGIWRPVRIEVLQ